MTTPMNVGIYVFEDMTMLDGYAPLQVLSFVEQFRTFTFSTDGVPVKSDCGALLTPDYGLDNCPDLDVLLMPGGGDVLGQMRDPALQAFLRDRGAKAGYITSVCTGALILAEAGLLDGYQASTHWAYLDQLASYPQVEVVDRRVAVDRNRITGGGVTAGLDFALVLVAEVVAPEVAQTIQLVFEYCPQPPFDSGSPDTAPEEIVARVRGLVDEKSRAMQEYLKEKHGA